MSHSSFDDRYEGEPSVPDPRGEERPPWPLYRLGFVAALVSIVGWWAGAALSGVFRLIAWMLGGLTALYAVYVLVLAAGWQVLSRGITRWFRRERRKAALRDHERLVELRFGSTRDAVPDFFDDLFDALDGGLGDIAESGDATTAGGSVTCYIHGADLQRMIDAVRRVAAAFPLPPDAYLWAPDLDRPGYGQVFSLQVSPTE